MDNLIFINQLGSDYKGNFMYEFIFGDEKNCDGEDWESKPANGYPKPPKIEYIKKVGILKNSKLKMELVQNSDFFSFFDAVDRVIALGWEVDEDIDFDYTTRLVFHFGMSEKEVKDKLYERDLIIEFEKNIVYED
jgi:hypothetical protein